MSTIQKNVKVLIISTGGTITMKSNENGALAPTKGYLVEHIRRITLGDGQCQKKLNEFVLRDQNTNIVCQIIEWEDPLDSSNISNKDWKKIAKQIKTHYSEFVGFVVLHGTDTMAYTASVLSMMLENLNKPVIITGAQVPIFNSPSDGWNNLASSILIAARYQFIQEVTIYFHNKLLRGNRSIKVSSTCFDAFTSPNCAPIAEFDIDFKIHNPGEMIKNNNCNNNNPSDSNLTLYPFNDPNIVIIHINPGITANLIGKMLEPPTEGAILLTYGAGNIPTISEIFSELENAIKRNVIIMNITQCMHGTVQPVYQTGQALRERNVIPGRDMTLEACYAKMLYVFARTEWDIETKRAKMVQNLRGEITIDHDIKI